jgi:hypothetical protein
MAAESIGAIYSTKIPGYADNADIQAAFKLYHYGSTDYNTANANTASLVNPSIAYTLNDLQGQITGLDPAGSVSKSIIDAKGDLLVGSANDTVDNLAVGSNNFVLVADSAQTLGIKWAAPAVSLDNSVTLTNKTLTSPVITTPTLSLSTSSSTDDSKISWDSTNKVLQVGNGSSVLNVPSFSVNTTAKTAAYTLTLTDQNTLIQMNGAYAFTVPLNATVAYPNGTQIHLIALSSDVTVSFTSGITSYATPGAKLRAAGSMATLIKLNTNTWVLAGDLIA